VDHSHSHSIDQSPLFHLLSSQQHSHISCMPSCQHCAPLIHLRSFHFVDISPQFSPLFHWLYRPFGFFRLASSVRGLPLHSFNLFRWRRFSLRQIHRKCSTGPSAAPHFSPPLFLFSSHLFSDERMQCWISRHPSELCNDFSLSKLRSGTQSPVVWSFPFTVITFLQWSFIATLRFWRVFVSLSSYRKFKAVRWFLLRRGSQGEMTRSGISSCVIVLRFWWNRWLSAMFLASFQRELSLQWCVPAGSFWSETVDACVHRRRAWSVMCQSRCGWWLPDSWRDSLSVFVTRINACMRATFFGVKANVNFLERSIGGGGGCPRGWRGIARLGTHYRSIRGHCSPFGTAHTRARAVAALDGGGVKIGCSVTVLSG
jgi:hypothetical protein